MKGCNFVLYGSDKAEWFRNAYSELEKQGDVVMMCGLTGKMGLLRAPFCRAHYSNRLNKLFSLPCKNIWYRHFSQEHKLDLDKKIYFVFNDTHPLAFDDKYHEYLRTYFLHAKLIFRFCGVHRVSWAYVYGYLDKLSKEYDLVITFDKGDAQKFGWVYHPAEYVETAVPDSDFPHSDVFFVGYAKIEQYPERFDTIISIYEKLRSAGLKCDFHIVGVDEAQRKYPEEITYNQPIPYSEVLARVQKSKCILEVVQSDQMGTTLRVQESILYGKKLLTNNTHIVNEPWYCSSNMQVFTAPGDVDPLFITEQEVVRHEVGDLFSPKKQLEFIKKYFENDLRGG